VQEPKKPKKWKNEEKTKKDAEKNKVKNKMSKEISYWHLAK